MYQIEGSRCIEGSGKVSKYLNGSHPRSIYKFWRSIFWAKLYFQAKFFIFKCKLATVLRKFVGKRYQIIVNSEKNRRSDGDSSTFLSLYVIQFRRTSNKLLHDSLRSGINNLKLGLAPRIIRFIIVEFASRSKICFPLISTSRRPDTFVRSRKRV